MPLQFFFEPVIFQLQTTDLGIQLLIAVITRCGARGGAPVKEILRVQQQMLLPLRDDDRMHRVDRGQFRHGLLAFDRFESDLRLQGLGVGLAWSGHFPSCSLSHNVAYVTVQEQGVTSKHRKTVLLINYYNIPMSDGRLDNLITGLVA